MAFCTFFSVVSYLVISCTNVYEPLVQQTGVVTFSQAAEFSPYLRKLFITVRSNITLSLMSNISSGIYPSVTSSLCMLHVPRISHYVIISYHIIYHKS